jgi:hypothetical protein
MPIHYTEALRAIRQGTGLDEWPPLVADLAAHFNNAADPVAIGVAALGHDVTTDSAAFILGELVLGVVEEPALNTTEFADRSFDNPFPPDLDELGPRGILEMMVARGNYPWKVAEGFAAADAAVAHTLAVVRSMEIVDDVGADELYASVMAVLETVRTKISAALERVNVPA